MTGLWTPWGRHVDGLAFVRRAHRFESLLERLSDAAYETQEAAA